MTEPRHCGNDSRIIRSDAGVGGHCAEEGCQQVLCHRCWQEGTRRCRTHSVSPVLTLEEARATHLRGDLPAFVTAEEARLRQVMFLDRFESSLRSVRRMGHPWAESMPRQRVPDAMGWGSAVSRGLEHGNEVLESAMDVPQAVLRNAGVAAPNLDNAKLFLAGERRSRPGMRDLKPLAVGAYVMSRPSRYTERGFDAEPFPGEQLLAALQWWLALVKREDIHCLLGIGSPTGWSDEAKRFIQGGGGRQGYPTEDVLACLVDLRDLSLYSNPLEQRIQPYLSIFAGELPHEIVARIMSLVQERLSVRYSCSAQEVSDTLGLGDLDLIHEVFADLQRKGGFAVHRLKDVGMVISRL